MLPPAAIYDSSSDSDQHIRGDYRLRNDFIHYLETKKVGWSPILYLLLVSNLLKHLYQLYGA